VKPGWHTQTGKFDINQGLDRRRRVHPAKVKLVSQRVDATPHGNGLRAQGVVRLRLTFKLDKLTAFAFQQSGKFVHRNTVFSPKALYLSQP
jgi:hypothetical protein